MSDTLWTGNAGEWSEAHVLMKLCCSSKIMRKQLGTIHDAAGCLTVLEIIKYNKQGEEIRLKIGPDRVSILCNGKFRKTVSAMRFENTDRKLLLNIEKQRGTFSHQPTQKLFEQIGLDSLKAGSDKKSDISVVVSDNITKEIRKMNFSIKSFEKSSPSLINAGRKSYIDYCLEDFTEYKASFVNCLEGSDIVGRTERVLSLSKGVPQPEIRDNIFYRNLLKCHRFAPEAVGYAFLYGQTIKGKNVFESVEKVKTYNPCGLTDRKIYEEAVKNYLTASACSMTPGKKYDGFSEIDGCIYADNSGAHKIFFEDIESLADTLFLSCNWDTPSTNRYADVGKVWRNADGKWFYTLNAAVRMNMKQSTAKVQNVEQYMAA